MRERIGEIGRINAILPGAFRSARVKMKVGAQLHSAQATEKYYEQGNIVQPGARAIRKPGRLLRRRTTGEELSGQLRFGNANFRIRKVRQRGTLRGDARPGDVQSD